MWHIPSRGRPDRCQALLYAMVKHGSTAGGVVWANKDDPDVRAYQELCLPPGWTLRLVEPGIVGLGEKLRRAFAEFRDDPWFGVLGDDMSVETPGFEQRLVAAAGAWGIASSNDGWQARADVRHGRMAGAAVFGGDLLRALGWWAPDGFQHLYLDDVWEKVGRDLGNWRCLIDVMVRHSAAPYLPGAEMDATAARVNSPEAFAAGKARFQKWAAAEADEPIGRARMDQWKAQGLSIERARKRSVLLAFPVYDKPHVEFTIAAMETVGLLTTLGIRHGFTQVRGQPIHTARNLLAQVFLDSNFTDLLFIDADMAWRDWDVVRLLAQRYPFLAGVGRRRNDVPSTDSKAWCFAPLEDLEPPHDAAGAFEARQVGTGFLLLNRIVFEAIAQHKPPALIKDGNGTLYRRYFRWASDDTCEVSEDYQFCRDYRDIGGRVMVDPTIELSHFGGQEHRARLLDLFA